MRVHFSTVILSLLPTFLGCAGARTPIVVPPEAVREWAYTPDGQSAPGKYVVRMSDGRREWEIEFPEDVYGSEVRVPLKNGGRQLPYSSDLPGRTAADRELDAEAARERSLDARDPMYSIVPGPGPAPTPKPGARPGTAPTAPKREKPSLLLGQQQIQELYRSKNYRVALVQLVELEKDYPDDEKLLAMKGSIYLKLGKPALAREAWERVLALNPDNSVVAAALRALADEENRAHPKTPAEGSEGTDKEQESP